MHAVGAWERQINCLVVLSLPLFVHMCNAILTCSARPCMNKHKHMVTEVVFGSRAYLDGVTLFYILSIEWLCSVFGSQNEVTLFFVWL